MQEHVDKAVTREICTEMSKNPKDTYWENSPQMGR